MKMREKLNLDRSKNNKKYPVVIFTNTKAKSAIE